MLQHRSKEAKVVALRVRSMAGNHRAGLGQPVALGIRELGVVEEALDRRIKGAATDAEELDLAAHGELDLSSGRPADEMAARFPVEPEFELRVLQDRTDAGLIDLLDQERDGHDDIGTDVLHRLHQDGRRRGLAQIEDAEAAEHAQHLLGGELVDMAHRQDGKGLHAGLGLEEVDAADVDVPDQILVGQHDPFALAGRATGENQASQILLVRSGFLPDFLPPLLRFRLGQAGARRFLETCTGAVQVLRLDQEQVLHADEFQLLMTRIALLEVLDVDNAPFHPALVDDVLHLLGAELGQDRDGSQSDAGQAEVCNHPGRARLPHQQHLVPLPVPAGNQEQAEVPALIAHLPVSHLARLVLPDGEG